MYDPDVKYTSTFLRELTPKELRILFEGAKKASLEVQGFKLIKKVTGDISSMRLLLNGFDSVYNEVHR